jgi:hypothetical protein
VSNWCNVFFLFFFYREELENTNCTFNSNDTITYIPRRKLHFELSSSVGDPETDRIIIPNIPLLVNNYYFGLACAVQNYVENIRSATYAGGFQEYDKFHLFRRCNYYKCSTDRNGNDSIQHEIIRNVQHFLNFPLWLDTFVLEKKIIIN